MSNTPVEINTKRYAGTGHSGDSHEEKLNRTIIDQATGFTFLTTAMEASLRKVVKIKGHNDTSVTDARQPATNAQEPEVRNSSGPSSAAGA